MDWARVEQSPAAEELSKQIFIMSSPAALLIGTTHMHIFKIETNKEKYLCSILR
jgi:hypothetical protein